MATLNEKDMDGVRHLAHLLIENNAVCQDKTVGQYKACDWFQGSVQMLASFVGGPDSFDTMLEPCAEACALVSKHPKKLNVGIDMILGAALRQRIVNCS